MRFFYNFWLGSSLKPYVFVTGVLQMFTEDYLMRIINLALAALMTAIGLKKAGKYTEARQAIQQAIEQLTTLPANLVDQMDDASILSILNSQGQLDVGRLTILADLYQEQGEILFKLDQTAQSSLAFARALRFTLEGMLADDRQLSPENMVTVETLVQRLKLVLLPIDTKLALSDYYQRLLDKDDRALAAGGTTRKQIEQALAKLQDQINASMNTTGD
jgi:tetratricopeptide (TPR) repeat protein